MPFQHPEAPIIIPCLDNNRLLTLHCFCTLLLFNQSPHRHKSDPIKIKVRLCLSPAQNLPMASHIPFTGTYKALLNLTSSLTVIPLITLPYLPVLLILGHSIYAPALLDVPFIDVCIAHFSSLLKIPSFSVRNFLAALSKFNAVFYPPLPFPFSLSLFFSPAHFSITYLIFIFNIFIVFSLHFSIRSYLLIFKNCILLIPFPFIQSQFYLFFPE